MGPTPKHDGPADPSGEGGPDAGQAWAGGLILALAVLIGLLTPLVFMLLMAVMRGG